MANAGGSYQRGPRAKKARLVSRTFDPRHIPEGEAPEPDESTDAEAPGAGAAEEPEE